MKPKNIAHALALAAFALLPALADPIVVEPVQAPVVTRVQAKLTPVQAQMLFSAFDLSIVSGLQFQSGQLMATPDGGLELRAAFAPTPTPTPTPEPTPEPSPEESPTPEPTSSPTPSPTPED